MNLTIGYLSRVKQHYFIVTLLATICFGPTTAQDKIILKENNETIEVSIIEVNDSLISYTVPGEEGGEVHVLKKEEYSGFLLGNFIEDQHKIKMSKEVEKKEEIPQPSYKGKFIHQSVVDFGIGSGPNYGGAIGVKAVIGNHGSGIMLGVGILGGFTGFAVGLQGSTNVLFFNVAYGSYGIHFDSNSGSELVKGLVGMLGGKINLFKNHMFIDLAVGYGFGYNFTTFYGAVIPVNLLQFQVGINFRIPK